MEFETHPESNHFIDAAMRSFDRHGAGGPTASIVQSAEPIELLSPAGLFLGEAGQFTPEVARMESACAWITHGLFFHETARRLAPGYDVHATVPGAIKVSRGDLVARLRWAMDFAFAGVARSLGNTFRYAFNRDPANPDRTVWILDFFERFPAIAVTGGREGRAPSPTS
ncbi:MAG: hypothetical protein ACREV5_03230 [Steroidobacter sp.]